MSSRDYYKRQALPPIRDVLGDQLDRPPHHDGAYSVDAMQRALPSPTEPSRSRSTWPPTTGPTLPPIHHTHGYASAPSRSHSHGHGHEHAPRSAHEHAHSSRGHHTPGPGGAPYSFDVFRPTSSGLVHASSSDRSQGILRTTRADAGRRHAPQTPREHDEEHDDTEKRYPCPHCGKRFSRPSSLKTHEVVHSDDKPYECPQPGCGKTFTVPSNMRRHFRKAHEGAGSGDDDDTEHYYAHARPATQGSSSQYYSSSRR